MQLHERQTFKWSALLLYDHFSLSWTESLRSLNTTVLDIKMGYILCITLGHQQWMNVTLCSVIYTYSHMCMHWCHSDVNASLSPRRMDGTEAAESACITANVLKTGSRCSWNYYQIYLYQDRSLCCILNLISKPIWPHGCSRRSWYDWQVAWTYCHVPGNC